MTIPMAMPTSVPTTNPMTISSRVIPALRKIVAGSARKAARTSDGAGKIRSSASKTMVAISQAAITTTPKIAAGTSCRMVAPAVGLLSSGERISSSGRVSGVIAVARRDGCASTPAA